MERYEGREAAAETFFKTNKGYDYILSCAVLEHIYDPESALSKMVGGLNPGGRLVHIVDLRDHGMFSAFHHELKFLEVPDVIYTHMTKAAGRSNRFLIDRYRTVLNNLPVSYELRISWLAGVGEMETYTRYEELPQEQRNASLNYVRGVRHRFARSPSSVSDEDLSVAAFVMIATRNKK
ncbi:MAG: methyltransferase domain-containing protein [Pseudomonadota bacterium]